MKDRPTKEESGENIGASLFSSSDDNSAEMLNFAEQFMDKVKAIHEHFDKNKDGFLNFDELSNLQLCTSGEVLDPEMYNYLCQQLGCQSDKGLSLDGLKLVYASEGTSADDDYEKIFKKKKESSVDNKQAKDEEEYVYEVGDDGVDISS